MKKFNLIALFLGLALLISAWMPLAHMPTSGLYVDPTHIGGLTYFTYLIPVLVILAAITGLSRSNTDMSWWYAGIAIFGGVIMTLSTWVALGHIQAFSSMGFGRGGEAKIGYGSIGMLVGMGVLGVLSYQVSKYRRG